MKLNPGKSAPHLAIIADNDIPLRRGLGSSACAVASGVILGYLFSGITPKKDILFNECVAIEGHPDNAGACIYGGFRVNKEIRRGGRKCPPVYVSMPFDVDYKINAHLVIPDIEISTAKARKILPEGYKREDVVKSVSSLSFVFAALRSGDWENLKYCDDYIHEPYRLGIDENLRNLFHELKKTNNGWTFLSGSGSTIIVMEKEDNPVDAAAIKEIIGSLMPACNYEKTAITKEGALWR